MEKFSKTNKINVDFEIDKFKNQIERIKDKKIRRNQRIKSVKEYITKKQDELKNHEELSKDLVTKYEVANKKDADSLITGKSRKEAKLQKLENQYAALGQKINDYKAYIEEWTNKRTERNKTREEKRNLSLERRSKEKLGDTIEKKEIYLSVLEQRNKKSDNFISLKKKKIESLKKELDEKKNTKIKMVKKESQKPAEKKSEKKTTSKPSPKAKSDNKSK